MRTSPVESIDSGSNYSFGDKMDINKAPRSMFDLTHKSTTTVPNSGLVHMPTWLETLPASDYDLNVDSLLRVMPQVVPLYSRSRQYVYAFYMRYADMWKNFKTFLKKGYSGNTIKQIPTLTANNCITPTSGVVEAGSFADYMGLPIGADVTALYSAGISALLPFMALCVYRTYFMNKNYFINDGILLPDDDDDFKLDDNGNLLSASANSKQLYFDIFSAPTSSTRSIEYDANGNLIFHGLFFHDYPDDYFLSALPFMQRGDTPTLDYEILQGSHNLDFSNVFNDMDIRKLDVVGSGPSKDPSKFNAQITVDNEGKVFLAPIGAIFEYSLNQSQQYNYDDSDVLETNKFKDGLISAFNDVNIVGAVSTNITLQKIRELAIKQQELERMARTDGSYREFGLSFFGEVSKSANDNRPVLIGATYKNIVYTEVLQTSGSSVGTTDPSNSSPLGAYAGHGIAGMSNGRLGHLHSDDFGYIMVLSCVMPDVYYHQGIDKSLTRTLQSQFFLPERCKLGLVPIENQELYYQGDNGTSEGEDKYLWGYQNIFDEYRYKPNKIHGKIADSDNKSFFPYTQARHFSGLPNYGKEFAEAHSVRKDSYFAPLEDAFSVDYQFNIRAVEPLPYKAIPAKLF